MLRRFGKVNGEPPKGLDGWGRWRRLMGMRQILVIMAAVMRLSVVAGEVVITDPVLKEAIGEKLEKPYGEFAPPIKLTEAEAAKVTELILSNTKITDAGLKEVGKLQQLEYLSLIHI